MSALKAGVESVEFVDQGDFSVEVEESMKLNGFGNGKYHRTDGPAIECVDGTKSWYLNGKLHRVDGPAIELENGHKAWYLNNQLHRIDGPAIERADGSKEWYLNDKEITLEVRSWLKQQRIKLPLKNESLSFFLLNFVGK